MSEEEKKAIEMLDKFIIEHKFYNIKQSDSLEDNIKKVLYLIDKQQKEIEELNEKISKAIGHIEACKTTLGNYILTPNEIECLLNILRK